MIYEETCGERETGPINGESMYAWGDVGRCDGDHGTHAPCPTGSPRATCRGAPSTAPHRAQRCQSTSRASRTAPPARRWRERACSSVSFRSRRTPHCIYSRARRRQTRAAAEQRSARAQSTPRSPGSTRRAAAAARQRRTSRVGVAPARQEKKTVTRLRRFDAKRGLRVHEYTAERCASATDVVRWYTAGQYACLSVCLCLAALRTRMSESR